MQDRGCVDLAQNCRCFAHGNGVAAKGFDRQAKPRQIIGDIQQAGGIPSRHFDDFGDQQGLRRNSVFGHLFFQFLIDQPFMGGVTIDDHDARFGLGDDVVFMHLRPRGPQW